MWIEESIEPCFDHIISIFANEPGLMILHSALIRASVGRYSFLCMHPFAQFEATDEGYFWNKAPISLSCPWTFIQTQLDRYAFPKHEGLPPFQGGAVGYFGYEFAHTLEQLPHVQDEIGLPTCLLNFYENVVAYDHETQTLFLMATGFSRDEQGGNEQRALTALERMKEQIAKGVSSRDAASYGSMLDGAMTSNFTQASYMQAVSDIKTHILDGDIFQANLTQQFRGSFIQPMDHLKWYQSVCKLNPAPFSALMRLSKDAWILSASPERFICLIGDEVKAEPIKGTRKRGDTPYEDEGLKQQLLESNKDHAENVMIVDLMRNDLSRVCLPGSIEVTQLCALHSFETVHHLISTVKGKLNPAYQAIDLLKATFPPGSVTGAPKIKAMEVISAIEKIGRGPYCGCFGYLSFTGDLDLAVTIRTYVVNGNQVSIGAGGGIVLDSEPLDEYEESLAKADRLISVLNGKDE